MVKAPTATKFYSYNQVSRLLAACRGALLVMDAAQGIQALTVANFYLAFESGLTIIPVINKIDQPTADPERAKAQLMSLTRAALLTSAKTGPGLERVLRAVVRRIAPPPPGKSNSPLRMLLLASYCDEYKGVICHVAVVDGAKDARVMVGSNWPKKHSMLAPTKL